MGKHQDYMLPSQPWEEHLVVLHWLIGFSVLYYCLYHETKFNWARPFRKTIAGKHYSILSSSSTLVSI